MSVKHNPDELLKLLVKSRSMIKFMDDYLDEQIRASIPALPDPPKEISKQLEEWIVFINEGIETRNELKEREGSPDCEYLPERKE